MTILRLSLFVFLTGGYTAFFRNRLKMNRRLTWVFTFSAITLILYVASLLNILLGAVYGICGLGAILSMYQIWRYMTKKDSIRGLDFTALAMLLYLLLFGAVLLQSPLLHFDNFTHWGSIVKFLFINDSLPTQQDTIIDFYTYPVGSSLFIYFFTKVVGFSEGVMLVGQLVLILSGSYAMFAALRDERRALPSAMIFATFAVFNVFNIAIRLNNLLVDFLLPVLALAAIAGCFAYRNQFWRMSLHTLVVLGLLSIVKVSGLFFVAIALFVYLFFVVRLIRRKIIRWWNLFPALLTAGLSFLPYLLWQIHMSLNFTNVSNAKHAVSFSEIDQILAGHMDDVAQEIITHFTKEVFQFGSLATRGIIGLNLVMLVAVIGFGLFAHRFRRLLATWVLLDVMIVAYYVGILLMYLTAMPTDEALELAGFERYASSMVIMAFGLMVMLLARETDRSLYEKTFEKRNLRSFKNLGTKRLYQYTSLALIGFSVFMLLSEINEIRHSNEYERVQSLEELRHLTGNRMTPSKTKILLVSSDKEKIDNYYPIRAARYYLWNVNVDGREDFDLSDSTFLYILKSYDEVLILDDHYSFNAMTKKLFGKTYKPGFHKTADLLANLKE